MRKQRHTEVHSMTKVTKLIYDKTVWSPSPLFFLTHHGMARVRKSLPGYMRGVEQANCNWRLVQRYTKGC